MKLTSLLDDLGSEHFELINKHGLSYLIEIDDEILLFDLGPDESAFFNAWQMNLPIDKVKKVIISHSHYDHATGLIFSDDHISPNEVITGRDFFKTKYVIENGIAVYGGPGFDENYLSLREIDHTVCFDELQITEHCKAVSSFERTTDFEKVPDSFVFREENSFQKDEVQDEVALLIDSPKGNIVIVGCSHPGIINILTSLEKRYGKIYAVIGGTHLMNESDERIKKTLETIRDMGIHHVYLSHCSGTKAQAVAEKIDDFTGSPMRVGSTIWF